MWTGVSQGFDLNLRKYTKITFILSEPSGKKTSESFVFEEVSKAYQKLSDTMFL